MAERTWSKPSVQYGFSQARIVARILVLASRTTDYVSELCEQKKAKEYTKRMSLAESANARQKELLGTVRPAYLFGHMSIRVRPL